MATNFTLGEIVRITGTFTQNSTLVDPATITLIIEENDTVPGSTIAMGGMTNPSVGTWYYDYDTSTGLIEYRWKTLNPQGAEEGWFTVDRSRVASP